MSEPEECPLSNGMFLSNGISRSRGKKVFFLCVRLSSVKPTRQSCGSYDKYRCVVAPTTVLANGTDCATWQHNGAQSAFHKGAFCTMYQRRGLQVIGGMRACEQYGEWLVCFERIVCAE